MRPQEEVKVIFNLLKAHLKQRRMSYSDLAKKMRMSESNIKRIFSNRSCGFEQIAMMCEASETSLFELTKLAAKAEFNSFILSESAETFFLNHFDCFIFYRNLGAASDTTTFLEKSKRTTEKTSLYLKDLERLGLIKKNGKTIELTNTGYLDLAKTPKLSKRMEKEWVPWFFSQVLEKKEAENQYFLKASSTGLNKTNQVQLRNEIQQLLQKYLEIGLRDQSFGAKEFDPVGVCIGIGPHRIGLFENTDGYTISLPTTKK